MGGLGDRLLVDVDCTRQINEQRFDRRSTRHVAWFERAVATWRVFGVGVAVTAVCEPLIASS